MVPEPKQSGFRTRSAHHDLTSLAVRVPRRDQKRSGSTSVSTVGFDESSRAGYFGEVRGSL